MTKRERLQPELKRLREVDGLKWREIGERLGLSGQTVSDYYYDPTGEASRARKLKGFRNCLGCGTPVNTDGRVTNASERCRPCASAHRSEVTRRWIVASFREWNATFGAPPSSVDWNPGLARNSVYCAWKAERLERTERPWPSSTLVQYHFGTWNAGLLAAGFEPLKPSEVWMGHAGVALRREDERLAA